MKIWISKILMVVILLMAKFCVAQQDSAQKTDFALTALRSMKLSGYPQFRYVEFPQNSKPDGFVIPRAKLDLKGSVDKKWEYQLKMDFAGASAKLIDGTLKYTHSGLINITGGQLKVPFSVENLIPVTKLEFINRSQVVQSLGARTTDVIGNQNERDYGVQVNGTFLKLNEINRIENWAGAFNGQGINTTDLNDAKNFCGRILFLPNKELKTGGASYIGYHKIGTGSTAINQILNRYGFEADYTTSRIIA